MPPRRSTRSTVGAVREPEPVPRSTRARRSTVESPPRRDEDSGSADESPSESEEEAVRSSPRRSSAARARPLSTASRARTRPIAASIPQSSPRPGVDSDSAEESSSAGEEEELPKKPPPRRSSALRGSVSTASRPSRVRSAATPIAESPVSSAAHSDGFPSESEEEEAPRKPHSRRTSAAPTKPASTGSRSRARTTTVSGVSPGPDSSPVKEKKEEDEDSEASTVRKPKGATKKQTRKAVVESSSSEEDLEEFVDIPKKPISRAVPRGRQSATPSSASVRGSLAPAVEPRTPPRGGKQGDQKTPTRPSPDSSPDIPSHVLPPRTPGRAPRTPGRMGSRTESAAGGAPPAGPKPRLTIHKLVLVNFKSYAGRQEIGPFHKSFSSIVGPNGSGKSNTIDALLFVFGYRASKMRQGKLSELIHNSAGKEGLENCSVEVWFREIVDLPGVDDFLLVPNSQLVVTRTAFRNNSSKYSINDRASSFTEVTTLLKAKGIDLDHNRFLILQGEVESIALMKAKAQNEHEDGLLEYLEDIIGTTRYKEPIEEASLEVEGFNEERGEKMNRLRVVEREKASLEDKKKEAEAFLRITNDLTRKKSLLWQFHMYTLQSNIEITTKAVESLETKLAEEQERNAHHLAQIEELQKGYDEKLAAFEEVKRLTDALVKDAKKFEKEQVGMGEKKKHLSSKEKKLKKSISDDTYTKQEAESTMKNCNAEIEANRAKVVELERKLEAEEAELEEVRDSLKGKTDQFTTQIEVKQRELEPWTAKISEKQSAIDVAQSERDLLAQKAASAQEALDEAKTALNDLRNGDQSKQDEYRALKKEGVTARRQLTEAEAKLQEMVVQLDSLRAKVTAARQKADEAKSSLAADRSENAVLASLNKLKAQGRIKGFHGRLGDLGVIDDQYDVAVTTACGPLNNLVVDTVEQGQACIEHLRKTGVGRASFIVLDKLPQRDLSPIETPENVPRLFDLIKPKDKRFAPAFYKGVYNTLVAKDLQQAQRIGYGKRRWRVVTLAGQLIDPSGTMSGGGTRVARGGMSSKFAGDKVAPEVVAQYEASATEMAQELSAFQAEKRSAEQEVSQLRKRLPEIDMELEKIELDVQTGAKRIAEAGKRLVELKGQSKPDAADEKRVKILDAEIEALTRDADKLKVKSGVINEQIKELQNKILEVGGVKLRAVQSRFATTKGLLDLASDAITKAEVGGAKAVRDTEKLDKTIAANTAKLDEISGELADVEGDLQACSADLVTIMEKVEEAQDASTEVKEALAESKAALDEASTEVTAFRKLEMDIKQKMEDNSRVQKDSKEKLRHWSKRHDELELAYIDEEDEAEDEPEDKPAEEGTPELQGANEENPVKAEPAESEDEDKDDKARDNLDEERRPEKSKKTAKHGTGLVEYSPDELRSVNKDVLNEEISQLEEEMAKAKPNLNVLHEYRRREAEFLDRARDLELVTTQRDGAKKRYDDLRKVRLDEFMAGFSAISAKLKEMYQMITMGGNAEIELVDTMDPFSEGVVLSIMPPKKSWRPIANLSGGEKTLASLALVFALHVFKPTPLYFMDEIDAALDFKNVSIVANYIQSKTQAAQFIVISLRNDMFELAHRLVGIYKTSNCTKSVAIDNKDLRTQAVVRKQLAQSAVAAPPPPRAEVPPSPSVAATPAASVR